MKADATLVQAGFALGRSYVPADYSSIFEKQYEGIIAANEAKAKMYGDIAMAAGKTIGGAIEDYGKRKGISNALDEEITTNPLEKPEDYEKRKAELDASSLEIDEQINKMATDYTSGAMTSLDAHLKSGGSINDLQFDTAQGEFERIKTGLEDISNKLFPSKEDKKLRNKLRKEATTLRSTLNNSVANIKAKGELYASSEVDLTSFENDVTIDKVEHLGPDLNFLVGQIFDPTTTKTDQIEFFFEDGRKMIRYAPGRAGIQYNKGQGTTSKEIPKSQWKTISENQLLNQIQPKDKATNVALNGSMEEVMNNSEGVVKGTKTPIITKFDDIYDRVYKGNVDILSGDDVNLRYAATQDQLVGNTTRNFGKDYLENYKVDEVIINQAGIGSDILKMIDINDDGFVNEADTDFAEKRGELDKHQAAKDAFMKKLTNPKTRDEKEALIGELAEYWTEHNRVAFDERRKKMGSGRGGDGGNRLGKNKTVQFRGPSGTVVKTTTNELQTKQNNLSALEESNSNSFATDKFVNMFGFRYGYFPGKGFAEVTVSESGQVTLPKNPNYFKTVNDVMVNMNANDKVAELD